MLGTNPPELFWESHQFQGPHAAFFAKTQRIEMMSLSAQKNLMYPVKFHTSWIQKALGLPCHP